MISTFQSIIDDIDKHKESLEWQTDTGIVFNGVLCCNENRIYLNVSTKYIETTVNFNYIYNTDDMGNKRTLYPYDIPSCKYIPKTILSNSYSVEAFIIVDEYINKASADNNKVSYCFNSFLCAKYPDTEEEVEEFYKLLGPLNNIDTKIGRISISIDGNTKISSYPPSKNESLDKITITIDTDLPMTNREMIMWQARFCQLLSLAHKEHAVTNMIIQNDINRIIIPSIIESHKEASYSFREPIFVSDFIELFAKIIPLYVDKYDKLCSVIENMYLYYRDYPIDPPDEIQLLRLFTSLEQIATYAQNSEKILHKEKTDEEKRRELEFDTLLKKIKADKTIIEDVQKYLKENTKKFYVTEGSLSSPKRKIVSLAEFLQKEYAEHTSLLDENNVELLLKMRNMLAHGYSDSEVHNKFYKQRNELGQDIEKCIRMYLLRAFGADAGLIKKHKEPLKARIFNGL